MFRHYIKTALREFSGNPVYNIISVVCLAVGTLIFAVLEYDLDNDMLFDRRLPWNDRIVEAVYVEHFDDGRPDTIAPFEILEQHHFETSGIELVSGSSFDRKYGEAYEEGITPHAEMVLTDPEGSSVAVTGSFDNVMSGYYKTRGLTLLYGDRVPMNRREIIVKESLLKRLSLNGDIGGYVLESSAPDGSIIHGTECRIVNVIKDDKWSRRIKADIFMFDQDNRKVYAVLAQGVDMDMANRMLESNSFTRGPRMLTPQVRALEPPMQDRSYIWKRLLSVLALIIGTICYLGNLVSSFSKRWAGNRLRLCLGSTRLGLGWMLICRILTTLFPSAVLAVVSALLLIPLLNSLDTVVVYYHLPYVIMLEVAVTVAVLLLCSIVVIAVIRYAGVSVTDRQNGLSHRERNILKYALLSVEIALSVMALGGSLSMIATMPRPYCPLSRHELSRILTLDMRNGAFGQSRDIITQKVKAIPDVEEVLVTEKPLHPEGRGFDQARVEQFRWFDEFAGYWSYSRYPQFICADSNYFSFFRIPVEQVLNDRSGQSVYVSESLWQSMADSIRGELDIPLFGIQELDMQIRLRGADGGLAHRLPGHVGGGGCGTAAQQQAQRQQPETDDSIAQGGSPSLRVFSIISPAASQKPSKMRVFLRRVDSIIYDLSADFYWFFHALASLFALSGSIGFITSRIHRLYRWILDQMLSSSRSRAAKKSAICRASIRAWLTSTVTGSSIRPPSSAYFPQVMRGLESAGCGTGWVRSL